MLQRNNLCMPKSDFVENVIVIDFFFCHFFIFQSEFTLAKDASVIFYKKKTTEKMYPWPCIGRFSKFSAWLRLEFIFLGSTYYHLFTNSLSAQNSMSVSSDVLIHSQLPTSRKWWLTLRHHHHSCWWVEGRNSLAKFVKIDPLIREKILRRRRGLKWKFRIKLRTSSSDQTTNHVFTNFLHLM